MRWSRRRQKVLPIDSFDKCPSLRLAWAGSPNTSNQQASQRRLLGPTCRPSHRVSLGRCLPLTPQTTAHLAFISSKARPSEDKMASPLTTSDLRGFLTMAPVSCRLRGPSGEGYLATSPFLLPTRLSLLIFLVDERRPLLQLLVQTQSSTRQ